MRIAQPRQSAKQDIDVAKFLNMDVNTRVTVLEKMEGLYAHEAPYEKLKILHEWKINYDHTVQLSRAARRTNSVDTLTRLSQFAQELNRTTRYIQQRPEIFGQNTLPAYLSAQDQIPLKLNSAGEIISAADQTAPVQLTPAAPPSSMPLPLLGAVQQFKGALLPEAMARDRSPLETQS
ncbi:MAG: hypothetical protein GF333_08060 [Candidatus Omnitrophica bacterium]|nr:hypothetical protein [Candidatus Omnitrophota bacterium]